MIIVQLNGGLGNQFFQYALARSISIKNDIPFALDISQFDNNNNLRTYRLKFFNIIENIATNEQISHIKFGLSTRFRSILKKFQILPYYKLNYIIETYERYYTYDSNIFAINKDVYLEGYWQSAKYFENIKTIIQKEFSLKNDLDDTSKFILNKIMNSESVSVHIRRGDYITNPIFNQVHGTCSLDYYQKAIDLVASNVDDPQFFFFSDDIQWVKENLKNEYPFYYVSNKNNEDYVDFSLMKNCKHHIIANSSFSWWGAWLSENSDKIVCAPSKWVNNRDIRLDDLLPKRWIRL